MLDLDAILLKAVELEASSVHLQVGDLPRFRLAGSIDACSDFNEFSTDDIDRLVAGLLSTSQECQFDTDGHLSLSYEHDEAGRFHFTAFRTHRGTTAIFRRLDREVPSPHALGLPKVVRNFPFLRSGLVLLSGERRSGRTTTLSSILHSIHRESPRHIVSVQPTVEYGLGEGRGFVDQRAVPLHSPDAASAVEFARSQEADVIAVETPLDSKTASSLLHAADGGTLVFCVVEAFGIPETLTAFYELFDPVAARSVRGPLSRCLKAIVSQTLLPAATGGGRVLGSEVLIANQAARRHIADGRECDILSIVPGGKQYGMQTIDDSLEELLARDAVSPVAALRVARKRARYKRMAQAAH